MLFFLRCMVVGCNNYSNNVSHVCYRCLPVGAPKRCRLRLLAIDIQTSIHRGMCCSKTAQFCMFAAIIFLTVTVAVRKRPLLMKTTISLVFSNCIEPPVQVSSLASQFLVSLSVSASALIACVLMLNDAQSS